MCVCVCVCVCAWTITIILILSDHANHTWRMHPELLSLCPQYVPNTSWLIIICGSENIPHNASINYRDMNFVCRLKDNHADIIRRFLICIHLNGKTLLKYMSTSVLSPSLYFGVCVFNAKVESKRSISETLSLTICIMFVFIQ